MDVRKILLSGIAIGFRVVVDDDDEDDDSNNVYVRKMGIHGGAVSWGTAPQAGSSRVRLPKGSLEFFVDIILPAHYGPGVDSAFNRNEYQEYFLGVKVAGA